MLIPAVPMTSNAPTPHQQGRHAVGASTPGSPTESTQPPQLDVPDRMSISAWRYHPDLDQYASIVIYAPASTHTTNLFCHSLIDRPIGIVYF